MIYQVILSYQQSDYIMLASSGLFFTSCIALTMIQIYQLFFVATPPSLPQHMIGNTHNQAPIVFHDEMPPGRIWVVIFFAALFLILSVVVAYTDDNDTVATLSAVESIILVMLLVSSWISAATPTVVDAHGEQEPLAPQDGTAAEMTSTSKQDGEMA